MKVVTRLTFPRQVLLPQVDLGDGRHAAAWLIIDRDKIQVRRFGSRKKVWLMSLREVAKMIAIRSQVKEARRVLATPDRPEGDAGPLFGEGG